TGSSSPLMTCVTGVCEITKLHQPAILDTPEPEHSLEILENRWTLQILLLLKERQRRFSDLRHALPAISANVLTTRMRSLESAGLVRRNYLPPPAASHVYELAPMADALRPALDRLADWRAGLQG
ncbi:MAG TPA: helix-turn-helix domain-containing protein, partial [Afipia sp.]